ncbi:unnamed protein product [Vitrella brassicaformis CCMP3155]|uniref:RNA polymerase Rpb4/RPC9 core domain-containing protein n=2 Tax=Vitrella brassicaformis TaxID=1169539 RepID=A0A0G4EIK0_VITBC|nr:unnamed protein product [Vitrella brassicaformis CCMP3155]|eukprot:CEL95712.1 unnamed protein product [Vitrella brassicaformis CCMP3155]
MAANKKESDEDQATILTLGEVVAVYSLEGNQAKIKAPAAKQALEYAKEFATIRNQHTMNDMRVHKFQHGEWLNGQLKGHEFASLVDLLPTDVEQAKALLPTLKRFSDDELSPVLEDLQTYAQEGGGQVEQ